MKVMILKSLKSDESGGDLVKHSDSESTDCEMDYDSDINNRDIFTTTSG